MTSDPRAALSTFVAALETHLELSAVRRGENDPAVVTAYNKVADAFVAYDDALLDAYGEVTPLDVYSDEEDEDVDEASIIEEGDYEDFDEGDDDNQDGDDDLDDDIAEEGRGGRGYLGLDDEEYDLDDGDDDDGDGDGDDDGGDDGDEDRDERDGA